MKRFERLDKIAGINLGHENLAGASLASSRDQYSQQVNQLEQLKIYKKEYQQQLKTRLETTISANEIRDYQYFFSSLDTAISQQVELVKQSAAQVEESRNNWLDKKREVAKISRVSENLRARETAAQLKNEQKITDEMNLSVFTMKQALLKPH